MPFGDAVEGVTGRSKGSAGLWWGCRRGQGLEMFMGVGVASLLFLHKPVLGAGSTYRTVVLSCVRL